MSILCKILWRGQRNQHQPLGELIIFMCLWAAEVQGQWDICKCSMGAQKEWLILIGVSEGARRGKSFKSLGKWQYFSTQRLWNEGHFWLLCDYIRQEFLCARISAPPPKNGQVHHRPPTKGRLITLSICSSYRKFTGSETNWTIVFGEFFSVKYFFLLGRDIFHFAVPLHILSCKGVGKIDNTGIPVTCVLPIFPTLWSKGSSGPFPFHSPFHSPSHSCACFSVY